MSETPLHKAANKGDTDEVIRLIENGTDLNAKNQYGQTPLHVALKFPDTVRALIERGADVNARRHGYTPLHDSASSGYIDTVRLLLEKGADRSVLPKPLDLANRHKEVARLLQSAEQTDSKFLAEFSGFSDYLNPAVMLDHLCPLITNAPELQLYYTTASVAYRQGKLTETERNTLIKKGLEVASNAAVNRESIVLFRVALRHAFQNNCISEAEQLALDTEAEKHKMDWPPFIKDMKGCIVVNAKSIIRMNGKSIIEDAKATDADDNAMRATSDALRTFQTVYKQRSRFESTVGFLKCVLNIFSFGMGGFNTKLWLDDIHVAEELSGAFDTIVDFSSVSDILHIVNNARLNRGQPAFDPKAFLNSGDGKDILTSAVFYGAGEVDGNVLSCEIEKRGINALEALAVAAEAASVFFELELIKETSTPPSAPLSWPPPPPETAIAWSLPPRAHAQQQPLADFLQENYFEQKVEDELTKNGFRTVRGLKTAADGHNGVPEFSAYMRSEGVNLKGGQFSELYAALMDL